MSFDLYPGAQLSTALNGHSRDATLGVVVRDPTDNRFYGVTALDFFLSGQAVTTGTSARKRVGARTSKFDDRPATETMGIMDMVGFLEVAGEATIDDRSPWIETPISKTVAPQDAVDESLTALTWQGKTIAVSMVSYGIDFEFEDPRDGIRIVTDGVEIVTDEPDALFAPGDAGAPVVTKAGQLLGIVVATDEKGAMVAPLHEAFKDLGLKVFVGMMRYQFRDNDQSEIVARADGAVRIAGRSLPQNKRVLIALRYIYGIGPKTSNDICEAVGIPLDKRVHQLSSVEVLRIRQYIEDNLKVEGDLRREVTMNIKRLMDLGCYRGLRHRRGLPVHGQRTHTNARTRKGPAKAIAGKKK